MTFQKFAVYIADTKITSFARQVASVLTSYDANAYFYHWPFPIPPFLPSTPKWVTHFGSVAVPVVVAWLL